MQENLQPYALRLLASDEEIESLFLALERDPSLPRRTLETIWQDVLDEVYRAYPRALPLPDDGGWTLETLSGVFGSIVRNMIEDRQPVEATPRESLVVALAATAYVVAPLVPPGDDAVPLPPRVKIEIPDDFDEQAMRDTIAVWCSNYLGFPSDMREHIINALRETLRQHEGLRSSRMEDAVQEAAHAASLIYGGATPGLIRHIITTGEVPKEAELLFGVRTRAEKEQLVADMRARFEELERAHARGPNLGALAIRIQDRTEKDDILRGLRGQWIEITRWLLGLLYPEIALAVIYGKPSDIFARALKAVSRARERHTKRAKRESQRQFSLDETPAPDREDSTLHEVIADKDADVERQADLGIDDTLAGIDLTPREREVAELRSKGLEQVDIAQILSLSEARISQIVKCIKCKLRGRDG